MDKQRCSWAAKPMMQVYHDAEWGVPVHDDRMHFELLCLEGAQAGLSWETVLKKRAEYRAVFFNFEPEQVIKINKADIEVMMHNAGIIRHRGKLESVVSNAQAFIGLQQEFGSFDAYVWRFVDGAPQVGYATDTGEFIARNNMSDALSKDLKKRGFKFVGSTIIYAYLQAAGLINDHQRGCSLAIK